MPPRSRKANKAKISLLNQKRAEEAKLLQNLEEQKNNSGEILGKEPDAKVNIIEAKPEGQPEIDIANLESSVENRDDIELSSIGHHVKDEDTDAETHRLKLTPRTYNRVYIPKRNTSYFRLQLLHLPLFIFIVKGILNEDGNCVAKIHPDVLRIGELSAQKLVNSPRFNGKIVKIPGNYYVIDGATNKMESVSRHIHILASLFRYKLSKVISSTNVTLAVS